MQSLCHEKHNTCPDTSVGPLSSPHTLVDGGCDRTRSTNNSGVCVAVPGPRARPTHAPCHTPTHWQDPKHDELIVLIKKLQAKVDTLEAKLK